MKSWLGQHKDILIMAWGAPKFVVPIKSSEKNDKIFYYYEVEYYKMHGKIDHRDLEKKFVDLFIQNIHYPENNKRKGVFYYKECVTRFFIDQQDIIRKVSWRGNHCQPYENY